MRGKTYFLLIGIISVVGFATAFIVQLIAIVQAVKTGAKPVFLDFLLLGIYLIVGPSLGLLFISHSEVLDRLDNMHGSSKSSSTTVKKVSKNNFHVRDYVTLNKTIEHKGVEIPSGCFGEILRIDGPNAIIVEFMSSQSDEPITVSVPENLLSLR